MHVLMRGGRRLGLLGATQPFPATCTRLLTYGDAPPPTSPPTEALGAPQPAPTVARRHSSAETGHQFRLRLDADAAGSRPLGRLPTCGIANR